jgi:hypothetical protein
LSAEESVLSEEVDRFFVHFFDVLAAGTGASVVLVGEPEVLDFFFAGEFEGDASVV